ncbi:hypothetical protein HAX54_001595 [Datura stramonium]|uniref:Uncharacterized protein n=1 Tax=Datura stramonium TaxID=4076 RepID=A0ABS8T3Q1_DATST|nr:hypothetical protein [Datura stramonium]
MEDALKKSQDKNIRRRKLKKRIIMEEEVQPKNILDLEGDLSEKEIDEDVAGGNMKSWCLQYEKLVSQSSIGERTRLSKKLSTKKIIDYMKRKSNEMLDEDVPKETSKTSKSKLRKMKESSMTEGSENSTIEVERLTGLLAQRDTKIAHLKETLQQASVKQEEELGPMNTHQ